MENDKFDGEVDEKDLVLEQIKFSTLPLIYMFEDIQKRLNFNERVVKINSMAIAWDVFDVCDKKLLLDAKKHH